MAKYLLLKHYRGAPAAVNDVPMDQWTPAEIQEHIQYMEDFADRLRESGEYVDSQALAADGAWVRYDGEGRPDLSNTGFMIDALKAAGNDADSQAIQRALIFVSRCQNLESEHNTTPGAAKVNDGGFYYGITAGGEDTREGLTAIVSVKLQEPQFESQTKAKLGNAEMRTQVEAVVGEAFSEWLEEHSKEAREIIQKGITAARAREARQRHAGVTRVVRSLCDRNCSRPL